MIFGQGTDHALWEKVGNAAWRSLGGALTAKPGAAAASATSYRVYARVATGAVWAHTHTAAGWGPWRSVGGNVRAGTGPDAAVNNGSFYVLVAGIDSALFIARDGSPGSPGPGGSPSPAPPWPTPPPAAYWWGSPGAPTALGSSTGSWPPPRAGTRWAAS